MPLHCPKEKEKKKKIHIKSEKIKEKEKFLMFKVFHNIYVLLYHIV